MQCANISRSISGIDGSYSHSLYFRYPRVVYMFFAGYIYPAADSSTRSTSIVLITFFNDLGGKIMNR